MESLSKIKQELKCYRIADTRYPIFSGDGAGRYPGRWNVEGDPIIYTCETYSGALLEKLAQTGIGNIPKNQNYIEITIPKGILSQQFNPSTISDWQTRGYGETQKFGSDWLRENRSLILIVPSVVVGREKNILINPYHRDFSKISHTPPDPVIWDERLFH